MYAWPLIAEKVLLRFVSHCSCGEPKRRPPTPSLLPHFKKERIQSENGFVATRAQPQELIHIALLPFGAASQMAWRTKDKNERAALKR
jgi:hypothetical protein